MQDEMIVKTPEQLARSETIASISAVEENIEKLKNKRSVRMGLMIFGAVVSLAWIGLYASASSQTKADPSSVVLLGPIFLMPILVIGIILVIIGLLGALIIESRIKEAIHARDVLANSLTSDNK